jgi:NADH:ubiquinone oxidoreductase subunit 3 (subunit A)
MTNWLFMPPVLFIVVFVAIWGLAKLLSGLAFHGAKRTHGGGEAYACGEENYDHLAQPDYSKFFPFAFFFTLAHVATLIMTTVPVGTFGPFVLAAVYMAGVAVGLHVLFRR